MVLLCPVDVTLGLRMTNSPVTNPVSVPHLLQAAANLFVEWSPKLLRLPHRPLRLTKVQASQVAQALVEDSKGLLDGPHRGDALRWQGVFRRGRKGFAAVRWRWFHHVAGGVFIQSPCQGETSAQPKEEGDGRYDCSPTPRTAGYGCASSMWGRLTERREILIGRV